MPVSQGENPKSHLANETLYLSAHLEDGLHKHPEVHRGDGDPPLVLLVQDGLLHLLERLPRGELSPAVVLPVRQERGQAVQDVPAQSPDRLVAG